jgi:hypothetical protein
MARNRKNQSAAVRFGPALKALLLCLLIGGTGVGYVWQQNQLLELGRQKAKKEKWLNVLRGHNSELVRRVAELESAGSLRERVKDLNKKLNLGLTMAQPTQVVQLVDAPLTQPAMNQTEAQYAQRQAAASPVP